MSASTSGQDPNFEGLSNLQVTKDAFGRPVIIIDDMMFHYKGSKMAASGGRAWPKGVIPVYFDKINEENQNQIWKAANLWSPAGIKFTQKTDKDHAYLHIISSKTNNLTTVGYGILGPHTCELVSWGDIPTLAHELGHAIGLEHEQSRSDRDDYIIVNTDNLTETGREQFSKSRGIRSQTSYDVQSIMHYKQFIADDRFVVDPSEPAFFLQPHLNISGKAGMGMKPTDLDIKGVAKLYGSGS